MAASPGRSSFSNHKKQIEIDYVANLKEIPEDELVNILPLKKALNIAAYSIKLCDLRGCLEPGYQDIKYNTAVYDDDLEEYIFDESMVGYVQIARDKGSHESAENVRILRSARAVIYLTNKDRSDNGI